MKFLKKSGGYWSRMNRTGFLRWVSWELEMEWEAGISYIVGLSCDFFDDLFDSIVCLWMCSLFCRLLR